MSRLDQLNKLWQIDETDADVAYMLATEHAKQGDADTSVSWYQKCLQLDTNYLYAHFHMAKVLEGVGKKDEAKAALTEGVAKARAASDAKALSELQGYLDSFAS